MVKRSSQKGFTLVELLIVVVVIVTLLGIVFRLAGMGGESKARATTIAHIQKLENCISGYYAAFGSYPPVPLHGVRDIYRKVNEETGMQYEDEDDSDTGILNWARVRAACRSQPVACEFPYNHKKVEKDDRFRGSGLDGHSVNPISSRGVVQKYDESAEWSDVQLFKFGLMSFLLPRYLFMMEGIGEHYSKQWLANNRLGALYNVKTGAALYSNGSGGGATWIKQLQQDLKCGESWSENANNDNNSHLAAVEMNPSQMVCTRWLPNLEGIVWGGQTFYGIDTAWWTGDYNGGGYRVWGVGDVNSEGGGNVAERFAVYSSGKASNGGTGSQPYLLDGMTVVDGWYHDLYYYSPPPYQNYRLWSAGPNGKTFAPWIDMKEYRQKKSRHAELAGEWMADDIVHMSN